MRFRRAALLITEPPWPPDHYTDGVRQSGMSSVSGQCEQPDGDLKVQGASAVVETLVLVCRPVVNTDARLAA